MNPEAQWAAIGRLAEWHEWVPLLQVRELAPKLPGVYLFRDPASHAIVYVGMAGERAGSGNAKGLWGRLGVYRIGKGIAGGFGEAVLDRALADVTFVERQLERLKAGESVRAKKWGTDAIEWWNPEVCWTIRSSKAEAQLFETEVIRALEGSELWNRGASRLSSTRVKLAPGVE